MDDFVKVVRVGTLPEYAYGCEDYPADVFCKVEFKDGKLSITGVVGPESNGGAIGGCGRYPPADETLAGYRPAPGWDRAKLDEFVRVWDRWHLNDMRAGSPPQMDWLAANPVSYTYPESHYEKAKEALREAGLEPDGNGYSYGSAWKREEVPEEVLAFLKALPDTDKQPAWV